MNIRGLPGIFAPRYHDLHEGSVNIVPSAVRFTMLIHSSCASAVASIVRSPAPRRCAMQSTIQSTCYSMETIILERTDGEPGPVIVHKFGKP